MKRIVIAGLIGAVVLFVWNFVSWMFIPWHMLEKLPAEPAIVEALREADVPSGIYTVPGIDHAAVAEQSAEEKAATEEAFRTAHKQGPLAFIAYHTEGAMPLSPLTMGVGFVLYFLQATVVAVILAMAGPALPGIVGRVLLVIMLGLFTAIGTDLVNWNWLRYPLGFSLEMAGDRLVSSLLLGVTLAILINPGSGGMDDMEFEVPAGV